MVKSPLEQQGLLHTGSVFYKEKSKGAGKPENAAKTPFKCDDLSKLCPDPCVDDEEMDAIAEHVGGKCERDPCSRVREPCESYIKTHIGGTKKPSKKTGSNKTETKPIPIPTASENKAETKPISTPTASKHKDTTSSKLATDANKKPTTCKKEKAAFSKKSIASQKTAPSKKPIASTKKPASSSKVPIDSNKKAICKKKPTVASQIKDTSNGKPTTNAKTPAKKK
ncbi:large ribosomal subunit protein uL23 [Drosophila virilis]